jgi:hypothetical protein
LPQPTGPEGVPGKNVSDEHAKATATPTALSAIGAPNPLPTQAASIGGERIVTVKLAMAI